MVFLFVSSLFPFLPFKMAKICLPFCLSKSQKGRQKTRPPPYMHICRRVKILALLKLLEPQTFHSPSRAGQELKLKSWPCLEAQQRYFSYRAILAAIVSQNSFVLVFAGYRTIIARYVAKWGIAQMCLCETKYQGGCIAPFWGSANLPEKVSRDMGYRSDSIAVSRDMGPLSGHVALQNLPKMANSLTSNLPFRVVGPNPEGLRHTN